MCRALGSRIEPSRRSARGQNASSFADVQESPLANSVTSWPTARSSQPSQYTTCSVPPYSLGGIASVNGAMCAICMKEPPHNHEKPPRPRRPSADHALLLVNSTRKQFLAHSGTVLLPREFCIAVPLPNW